MNEEDLKKIVREEIRKVAKPELEEINELEERWLKDKISNAWSGAKNVGRAFGREARETVIAAKILMKIIKKDEVSDDEIQFLKDQSKDIAKALALIGLQAVPGSSAAIVALEQILKKKGITLFPKAQTIPNQPPTAV